MRLSAEWVVGAIRRRLEQAGTVNNWPGIIQDWLYPPTCLLCGDPGSPGRDLCPPCAEALPRLGPACPRCAGPLADPEAGRCRRCRYRPPAFDAAVAAFRYEDPIRHLLLSLKFGARHPAARLLGMLLAERLAGRGDLPEAIIPVPLHASRYRERGYNQAIEIGRALSAQLGVPLDPGACGRVRATTPQARLSGQARRRNLTGAFAARPELRYRHVAILDDVLTTGATANEVALALRRVGVDKIEVWACARAGR